MTDPDEDPVVRELRWVREDREARLADLESKGRGFPWLFVAVSVLVVLLGAFWLTGVKSPYRQPDNAVPVGSATIPRLSEPSSIDNTARPVPDAISCSSDLSGRPKSGAELGGRLRGGMGKVRVENDTGSDAVAVLVDLPTGIARRAIFIRAGESGSITSVPVGHYRLRFQLGSDWLSERRFCQISGTSEFDEAFEFQEIKSDLQTEYSTYEITLNPVLFGTAKTHHVPNSAFEVPER